MKFKEFYNPRQVYDGYFETYFIRPFFHHYADFRTAESARTLLLSLAAWVAVTLGLAGILMGLVGLLGPEVGFAALRVIGIIWLALSLCPLLAMAVRASRREPHDQLSPKFLGVDTLLFTSSLLFFILGLLMMTTTVNSGYLNPNAGMTDEADTSSVELEEVTEVPIFTYQDEAVADTAAPADTLPDLVEPDLIAPDESFDPTIVTPADEILNETASDSI